MHVWSFWEIVGPLNGGVRLMAKSARGERGVQGIPGPHGPPGLTGATGAQGEVGQPGAIGNAGPRGAKGTAGAKGAKGHHGAKGAAGREPPRRRKLLDVVQVQINRIDHELHVQMTRMAQIQSEVDQLRGNLKRLAED